MTPHNIDGRCCCADKYCSPTRTAIQSGRNPYHVNPLNADPDIYNPADPVSGMASMPRNSPSPLRQQNLELMKLTGAACLFAVTGMAMKMAAAGYQTHMFGKWRVPRSRRSFAVALVLTGFCVRRDVGRS